MTPNTDSSYADSPDDADDDADDAPDSADSPDAAEYNAAYPKSINLSLRNWNSKIAPQHQKNNKNNMTPNTDAPDADASDAADNDAAYPYSLNNLKTIRITWIQTLMPPTMMTLMLLMMMLPLPTRLS